MSWKPRVRGVGETNFTPNGQAFATKIEAEKAAKSIFQRWFGCDAWDVIESDEEVNYVITDDNFEMTLEEYKKLNKHIDDHILIVSLPKEEPVEKKRTIRDIAIEIRKYWKNVWFGAKPYLDAMMSLDSIEDNYGMDSGKSIVLYFLANAATWKGEKAREIKKELKGLVKESK